MVVAKIRVDGTFASVVMRRTITAGLVGATVLVEYVPGIWDGLTKTVVFKGTETKDNITNETTIEIPGEVLTEPGKRLLVGFFGIDADKKQIVPTIWVNLGPIYPGADPSGDTSTDPVLPVWGQIADKVEKLSEEVDTLKQTGGGGPGTPGAPGADGEGGGYYTPEVTQPDEDTIQFKFTPSKEGMPAIDPAQIELPAGPQGRPGQPGRDGLDGKDGKDGKDGVVAVTGATVGQTVKIAAVDEKGVPTAWESVDFPSGGGGSAENDNDWEIINELTIGEEGITSFLFDKDKNGNPFELSDVKLISGYQSSLGGTWDGGARTRLVINGRDVNAHVGALSTAARHFIAIAFLINGRIYEGNANFPGVTQPYDALPIRPVEELNANSITSIGIRIDWPGTGYFAVGYSLTLLGRRKK